MDKLHAACDLPGQPLREGAVLRVSVTSAECAGRRLTEGGETAHKPHHDEDLSTHRDLLLWQTDYELVTNGWRAAAFLTQNGVRHALPAGKGTVP